MKTFPEKVFFRFLGELNRRPQAATLGCLVSVAFLGAVDYETGFELSFSIFYVAPIAVAAWVAGGKAAVVLSLLSAATWLAMDAAAGNRYPNLLFPLWNAGVRLGYFLIISRLLVSMREALRVERRLSRTDGLTGLLNGRAFHEEALRHVERLVRAGKAFTLAYIDVDNFKTVNDTLGHSEGDRLLHMTAGRLKASTREVDIVARLGGDEFAVLLTDTDAEGAKGFVTRVTGLLEAAVSENDWPVSFSMGVATFRSSVKSVDEAIHAADSLMYEVKKSTKGRALHRVWDGGWVSLSGERQPDTP